MIGLTGDAVFAHQDVEHVTHAVRGDRSDVAGTDEAATPDPSFESLAADCLAAALTDRPGHFGQGEQLIAGFLEASDAPRVYVSGTYTH